MESKRWDKTGKPEVGEYTECPECGYAMCWVELGEPEGDMFHCEECDFECDENMKELE